MASNNFAKNEPVACSRFKAKPESCTLGYVVNDLFTIGRVYRFDPNTCAAGISARLRVAGESMRVGAAFADAKLVWRFKASAALPLSRKTRHHWAEVQRTQRDGMVSSSFLTICYAY